jgi:hypothetical protein
MLDDINLIYKYIFIKNFLPGKTMLQGPSLPLGQVLLINIKLYREEIGQSICG